MKSLMSLGVECNAYITLQLVDNDLICTCWVLYMHYGLSGMQICLCTDWTYFARRYRKFEDIPLSTAIFSEAMTFINHIKADTIHNEW